MLKAQSIGFIGGGNMGSALIQGLLRQQYDPQQIFVGDHGQATCNRLKEKWGIHAHTNNTLIAQQVDILVLAVKPSTMKNVVTELASVIQARSILVISIAAGIQTTQIQRWLQAPHPVIRAMPNTPALLGHGITALYATQPISQDHFTQATELLNTVGETVWIEKESLMDVVTALSGSGPAYFFYLFESLIQSAQDLGLPEELAKKLTLYTALGSTQMALESSEDLALLRQKVTSPGGTTEQGINVLKNGKLDRLLDETLRAAAKHGQVLSQKYD